MSNIDLLRDGSELVHYDEPGIPIYITTGHVLGFPEGKVLAHWHEDIEFSCVLEGRMEYEINGKHVSVSEGDCLFINSSQVHYNYSLDGKDCTYICILLHPSLLAGNPNIYDKLVRPIVEHKGIEYIQYDRNDSENDEIYRLIQSMMALKQNPGELYELRILTKMCDLWEILYRDLKPLLKTRSEKVHPDIALLRKMILHISNNYPSNISLEDIANAANISRSKCCRIFQTYIGTTPITFLNEYRLKASEDMLSGSDEKISDIAMNCGFSSFSYYSKVFREKYNMTPREYRLSSKQ